MCFVLVPLQHLATSGSFQEQRQPTQKDLENESQHRTSSFFSDEILLHIPLSRIESHDQSFGGCCKVNWGSDWIGPTKVGSGTVWFWEWKSNDRAGGAASSKGDGRHGPVFREIANMEDATIPRPRARRAELNLFQASIGSAMGWLRCATELYVWRLFFPRASAVFKKKCPYFPFTNAWEHLTCKLHSIITSLTSLPSHQFYCSCSSWSQWFSMIQQCLLRISRRSFCLWWIYVGETNGSCRPFLPNSTRNTHLHSLNIKWNILSIVEAGVEIFVQCLGKDSLRVPLNLSGLLAGIDSTDSFLCCQTGGVRCFSCANAAWRRSHHHTVLVMNARLLHCGSRGSDLSRLRHTDWSFLRSKSGAVKNKPCICSASILDHRPAGVAVVMVLCKSPRLSKGFKALLMWIHWIHHVFCLF